MVKAGHLLILGVLGLLYVPFYILVLPHSTIDRIVASKQTRPQEIPIIFYYEEHVTNWFVIFNLSKRCPDYCIFTKDLDYYNRSNAVIFFRTLFKPPPPKFDNQIWIYFTFEPPTKTEIPNNSSQWGPYVDKFDWIMSYRPNSDIHIPFGRLKKLPDNYILQYNFAEIYRKKTRDVAWLVSNCYTHSLRENYIRKLRKYITVDIYGGCGDKRCPVEQKPDVPYVESLTNCKAHISRNYKFYLAFENSLCENYSTEKLYGMYETDNLMVPVVRGDPNVSRIFPRKTFISANKYPSPLSLALYLNYVGSSEKIYTRFLKEKLKYNVTLWTDNYYQSICDLCTKLVATNGRLHKDKTFNLVERLFSDKCYQPSDI